MRLLSGLIGDEVVIGVASKHNDVPAGLSVPDTQVLIETCAPWGVAANNLLDRFIGETTAEWLLFADDDIEVCDITFAGLDKMKDRADIWGFCLCYPNGNVQSAGHIYLSPDAPLTPLNSYPHRLLWPSYVAHVTASCFLLNRRVIKGGLRFPLWPGQHYEDVLFTLYAWMCGYKVAYWPGPCIHDCDSGVGRTKGQEADFEERRKVNHGLLMEWQEQVGLKAALQNGVVPLGADIIK